MSNLPAKRMFLSVHPRLFAAILAGLTAFSCSKAKDEQPPLTRDQMVSVMMEIYLAEARMSIVPVNRDSAYRLFVPFQDSLLTQRGFTDSTLRKAYDYYLRHPSELEEIYDAMIDSLTLREQRRRSEPN